MGQKDENDSEEDSSEENPQSDDTVETEPSDDKETNSKPPKQSDKTEDIKKDPEELRKVIKLDSNESEKPGKEEKEEVKNDVPPPDDSEPDERKTLEQKRAILQNIKDFDFQIKKNQTEITNLNKKIGSVTKDLDDLVSLYEIVSEQMNPFVGLSKVTKKRIDALENFMSDIDDLKNRVGDLESFAEQTTGNFDELKNIKDSQKEFLQKAKSMGSDKFGKGKQSQGLSDEDIDMIIDKSFKALNLDKKIDKIIDEYVDEIEKENKNLGD